MNKDLWSNPNGWQAKHLFNREAKKEKFLNCNCKIRKVITIKLKDDKRIIIKDDGDNQKLFFRNYGIEVKQYNGERVSSEHYYPLHMVRSIITEYKTKEK